MPIHIYHPNRAVKGFACSFWTATDGAIFATLLKQSGWDDAAKTGTFKDSVNSSTGKVNIKLTPVEVCAILDCIERNRPFSTYHDFDKSPKSISFSPWMNPAVDDAAPTQKGYSFSITVGEKSATDKNSFYIGLTFAEARLIREFLMFAIQYQFKMADIVYQESKPEKQSAETPIAPVSKRGEDLGLDDF